MNVVFFATLLSGAPLWSDTPDSVTSKALALPPAVERTVDFEVDVEPILKKKCGLCHGP